MRRTPWIARETNMHVAVSAKPLTHDLHEGLLASH
jgi:hypothetical protein